MKRLQYDLCGKTHFCSQTLIVFFLRQLQFLHFVRWFTVHSSWPFPQCHAFFCYKSVCWVKQYKILSWKPDKWCPLFCWCRNTLKKFSKFVIRKFPLSNLFSLTLSCSPNTTSMLYHLDNWWAKFYNQESLKERNSDLILWIKGARMGAEEED